MFFGLCADPDPGLSYGHPAHERRWLACYNDALARRGLTFTQQAGVLAATAKRGRQGTTLVRRLLLRFPPAHEPSTTDTEFLFLEIVEAYSLPTPRREYPISGPDGFIGVVDNAWPGPTLVVEIDSRWHDGPLDTLEDLERDARLGAAGWHVQRWRYRDLVATPGGIASTIKRSIIERTP